LFIENPHGYYVGRISIHYGIKATNYATELPEIITQNKPVLGGGDKLFYDIN
jgi:hypothetical protein